MMVRGESGAMIRRFLRSTAGVTSIEYALIATLVSVSIVAGATAVGTRLNVVFASVSSGFR